jgi:hypothetical protein
MDCTFCHGTGKSTIYGTGKSTIYGTGKSTVDCTFCHGTGKILRAISPSSAFAGAIGTCTVEWRDLCELWGVATWP